MMRNSNNMSENVKGRAPHTRRGSGVRRIGNVKSIYDYSVARRGSLYEEVTTKIIAQLEAGCFPWVQPWDAGRIAPGMPRNVVTGRPYSGINVLILWGAVIENAYPSQDWLTFKQAKAAGGCVRKGEKGQTIFYADRITPDAERQRGEHEGEGQRSIPFLKRFTVFNAAQCDGLPNEIAVSPAPLPERQPVAHVEALIAATGADLRIGGAHAFYNLTEDYVQVPPQQAFMQQINYYRTVCHELAHWSGHPTRLARIYGQRFGDLAYAREELCAELASAFLCAALGIVPTVRHADYLDSWLAVLHKDSRAIFKAASNASKAADYLLAFLPEPERVPR